MTRMPRNVPSFLPLLVVLTGLFSVLAFSLVLYLETDSFLDIIAQTLSALSFYLQVALFLVWALLLNQNIKLTYLRAEEFIPQADEETSFDLRWLQTNLRKTAVPLWPLALLTVFNTLSLLFDFDLYLLSLASVSLSLFFLYRLLFCSRQLLTLKSNFYSFYKVEGYTDQFQSIFPNRTLLSFTLLVFLTLGFYLFYFFLRFSAELNLYLALDGGYLDRLALPEKPGD